MKGILKEAAQQCGTRGGNKVKPRMAGFGFAADGGVSGGAAARWAAVEQDGGGAAGGDAVESTPWPARQVLQHLRHLGHPESHGERHRQDHQGAAVQLLAGDDAHPGGGDGAEHDDGGAASTGSGIVVPGSPPPGTGRAGPAWRR